MIALYGFSPSFGVLDLSPFVVKVATYLRMVGVDFALKVGDARKAPKGKLPFIKDGDRAIADSTTIVDYLRKTYKDLDVGMSPADSAQATAYQAMLEEHFYFTMVTLRWVDDRGWAVLSPSLATILKKAGVPGLLVGTLMGVIRNRVRRTVHAQGTGRHSIDDVEAMAIRHIDALSTALGDKPYFLGDALRSIDATIFAFLWVTLDTPFEGRVKAHMAGKPNLVAYKNRLKTQYFKDYCGPSGETAA